jgi:hypothetical protein
MKEMMILDQMMRNMTILQEQILMRKRNTILQKELKRRKLRIQ